MIVNTWINDELVTFDTEDVWLDTFTHWDALVATDRQRRSRRRLSRRSEAAEAVR